MAIAPMKKVQVYAHQSRAAALLKAVQALEIMEITDVDEDFFAAVPENEDRKVLKTALEFLKELFPTPKAFIENFINFRTIVKPIQLKETVAQKKKILLAARDIVRKKAVWDELQQHIAQLESDIDRLSLYIRYSVQLTKLPRVRSIRFIFGYFELSWYEKRQKAADLPVFPAEVHEEFMSRDEKNRYVIFCSTKEAEQELRDILQACAFTEVTLPVAVKPFPEQLARARKELAVCMKQKKALLSELKAFHEKEQVRLQIVADHAGNEDLIAQWSANLLKTKKVVLLEGWIPERRMTELRHSLSSFEKDILMLDAPHSEDDVPPVLLENKALAPFEAVTTVYGLPHGNEFDPTPYLSVFFIIYYGLCLSDAGYGLMLVGLAYFLLKKYHVQLTGFGRKLLKLNIFCGFSTMIVGILTGSYFGFDINMLTHAGLKQFLLSLKIADPIANPLPMLILSVILGMTQIYVGLWVRYFIDIKQKGYREAFLLSGIWVYFITGIIAWPLFASVMPVLSVIGKFMVWSGMITLVLTQGRHHKNPFMRLGSGLLSLYKLTGFVGDILSYSRLFALGLVTAVLAMVINLLAFMTGGIPIIGKLVMVAILFGGHLFDFFINILGSFVHSARLQYVEYFSKFFEGGGRAFKPFVWEKRYIKIEE